MAGAEAVTLTSPIPLAVGDEERMAAMLTEVATVVMGWRAVAVEEAYSTVYEMDPGEGRVSRR